MSRIGPSLSAIWSRLSRGVAGFWERLGADASLRRRVIAISAAVLLLALTSGIALAALQPFAPSAAVVARVAPTATTTATSTATSTATATAKPTAKPTSQKPVPTLPPAPPAPPPPPAQPPTPAPTSGSGTPTIDDSIFSQFCSASSSTPTPTAPPPTPTDTPPPPTGTTTTTATGTASTGAPVVGLAIPTCLNSPYYAGNNPSQSQINAALTSAASTYGIPLHLLQAVAWQESKWHEDVFTSDGGIGLMQIQYYTYPWLNQQSAPACKIPGGSIPVTNYNPYTLDGNAKLGAKYLAWLSCYYSYWGNNGGGSTLSNPSPYTVDWYYRNAGLHYPDSSDPGSLCAAVFNANGYYPALPSTTSDPWSCPYSATAGDTTLLDITISAYNEGAGNVAKYGINNMWYVNAVEGYIPQFASGALPVAS